MRYRDAIKLLNEDEVVMKGTGEVLRVLRAYKGAEKMRLNNRMIDVVLIECLGPESGYINTVPHTDVE